MDSSTTQQNKATTQPEKELIFTMKLWKLALFVTHHIELDIKGGMGRKTNFFIPGWNLQHVIMSLPLSQKI
jgi:hypothetical protein